MNGPGTSSEGAYAYHEMLLEVLRQLNRSGERAGSVEGLELVELARVMNAFWASRLLPDQLDGALALLVENGLVRTDEAPVYAWDRQRTLGRRYLITPLGKSYLVRQLEEFDRIR